MPMAKTQIYNCSINRSVVLDYTFIISNNHTYILQQIGYNRTSGNFLIHTKTIQNKTEKNRLDLKSIKIKPE